MRLIDADHLLFLLNSAIELRKKLHRNTSDLDMMVDSVNNEPTAYDPDKVVEQLYGLKKYGTKYDSYWDSSLYQMTEFENKTINDAVEKAIEIVKGGVVDG